MARPSDETYELEGTVEHTTAKARLIEFTNGRTVWVPKSCIVEEYPSDADSDVYVFVIKQWFAEKEGLA
jgi:hypothetical protein